METQESGTGRVRFITRAFPRAFPPQWKAGLMGQIRVAYFDKGVPPIDLNLSERCPRDIFKKWISEFSTLSTIGATLKP